MTIYSNPKLKSAMEVCFLALLGVYLGCQALSITTCFFQIPSFVQDRLLELLIAVVAVKAVAQDKKNRLLWFSLATVPVYLLSWHATGYAFLLFLAVLTVGCSDIPYRRILWTFLISVGTVVTASILCSFAGVIENLIYTGIRLRSSWGICYPTDCSTIILFLLLSHAGIASGRERDAMAETDHERHPLIAVHAFSEHHFPEINYNILLIMPFVQLLLAEQAAGIPDNGGCAGCTRCGWRRGIPGRVPV